jgi:hypothetical protein
MTLAEKFWEWDRKERIRWKYDDHRELVHQFDSGAVVTIFTRPPYEVYDEQTYVTFSDGSQTNFNYKGEG